MAVSLPDDVVLEILARLKNIPAVLFRCATTCKRWRDLVADLSFLRLCWPEKATFVGFVARERLLQQRDTEAGIVPAPQSALGRHGILSIRSFVPALPAGAVPLVSRHGLLLVRLDAGPNVVQLAVCNLQVGTCHMLPALSSGYLFAHDYEVNSYAILTAADCCSDVHDKQPPPQQSNPSTFFKVIIIGYGRGDLLKFDLLKYHLHTYSSHETSWRTRFDCFESTALGFTSLGYFSDAAVRGGTTHWCFRDWEERLFYAVILNTKTQHISLSKLPFPTSFVPTPYYRRNCPCLILSDEEALSLLHMQHKVPLLEIWGKQEKEGTSEWFCNRTIELKEPGRKKESKKRKLHLLGEKCGTLLVSDSHERVYTADLKTGTMVRVQEWPHEGHMKPGEIVPVEIDWPSLFVSRLGTKYG